MAEPATGRDRFVRIGRSFQPFNRVETGRVSMTREGSGIGVQEKEARPERGEGVEGNERARTLDRGHVEERASERVWRWRAHR